MDFLTKCSISGQVMLLGLVVVFFGLFILVAFIKLMSWIMGRRAKPVATPAVQAAPVAVPEVVPAAEPVVEENQDELIAVITAAIMAYAPSGKQLVVKSVRRVSAWSKAGRDEQIASRF